MLCTLTVGASDLRVLDSDELFFFGGGKVQIPVHLENSGREGRSTRLSYRLFQLTSSTRAPLEAAAVSGTNIFSPGMQSVVLLELALPSVRTITPFALKVSDNEQEIGWVKLRLCPEQLLQGVASLAPNVALFDLKNELAPLFAANQITTSPLRPGAPLTIVHLPERSAETSWKEQRPAALGKILYLAGPGVTGAERLMPLKAIDADRMILQTWYLPNLSSNALSQLRFMRALELLIGTNQPTEPGSK